ncbi:MAG: bifunctional 3-(3-hydroxy-phenyl)propionate/3-hydroxycinnamic acid hydroxylase [Gammaproteobacteria bacterium]
MSGSRVHCDVLIVGLGPVGAALANVLGAYGVATLVVERDTDIFTAPRAIALDNEALRILQLAGMSEDAFERLAIPTVELRSPQFGRFARIDSAGEIDGHPKLVTFFQPALEHALRRRLESRPSVTVMTGTECLDFEQDEAGVTARLRSADGENVSVEAGYLVGADGAGSQVRKRIGQDFRGKTYAEDWLIVDALDVPTPIDHVEFLCDPKRPAVHMIAPGNRQRWEFMLLPGETAQEMERDETIAGLLAPWVGDAVPNVERKAVYRFHARTVEAFSSGRVFLVGDAAHITPPFAGQGLVAGLRDVANLGWKLAWVVRGLAAPDTLASYDEERRPHAKAMIGLAKFLGRLIMPRSAAAAALTHGGVRLLRVLPWMRSWFDNLGMKPKNEYRRGLFVRRHGAGRLVRGGLLPQGWLRRADGAVVPGDDALGDGFCVVGFGVDPDRHLDPETRAALEAIGGRTLHIGHRGQQLDRAPDGRYFEDLGDAFVPARAPVGWAAIVRPDRIVMHDGPVTEAARLVRESIALLEGAHAAAPLPNVR